MTVKSISYKFQSVNMKYRENLIKALETCNKIN